MSDTQTTPMPEGLKSKPVIVKLVRSDADDAQYAHAAEMVGELFYEMEVSTDEKSLARTAPDLKAEDIVKVLVQRIAQLDEEINEGLSTVMHDEGFQELEATWRGLHYLVSNAETGEMLKLRVLDATKEEIGKDLAKAVEFDQSTQFKKIYEEEYGTFGGSPYSMLLGDYKFKATQPDLEFLEKMSGVAAAAHAPFIAAADPGLFDLESFGELNNPRDLTKIFGSTLFAKWKSFRESEDSRYVALCLPRFLLRTPYGSDDYKPVNPKTGEELPPDSKTKKAPKESLVGRAPAEAVSFQEQMVQSGNGADPEAKNFLWGNPAFLLTERITNAFSLYKWTAAIRGVEGG
ncbi:MAG TPA: type VI secretion system contractile sheath large subunit, partial [Pyrinomonadaceae bacterium]|nr:type VI secretion system contractile sheath large subunit [Pyrinomonadaceae bacterium]